MIDATNSRAIRLMLREAIGSHSLKDAVVVATSEVMPQIPSTFGLPGLPTWLQDAAVERAMLMLQSVEV
jgi:hypothetical protein